MSSLQILKLTDAFIKPEHYPTGILDLAERTKQPVTLHDLLTLRSSSEVDVYAASVMVITGGKSIEIFSRLYALLAKTD